MTAQNPKTQSWQVDPNAAQAELEQGVDGITGAIVLFRQKLLAGGVGPEAADRMCEGFFAMLLRNMGGAQ
jgi:hypothetical protein